MLQQTTECNCTLEMTFSELCETCQNDMLNIMKAYEKSEKHGKEDKQLTEQTLRLMSQNM